MSTLQNEVIERLQNDLQYKVCCALKYLCLNTILSLQGIRLRTSAVLTFVFMMCNGSTFYNTNLFCLEKCI